MDFHSSRISRSRSPATFHCVASVLIFSASAQSCSLRSVLSWRMRSFSSFACAAASSECSTIAASLRAKDSRSPITAAVGKVSASCVAAIFVLRASPEPDASRASSSVTSVARSSNRRPKWARPSAASPACHEPTWRSPSAVLTQAVPSSSTRPKWLGSLCAGITTVCDCAGPGLGGDGLNPPGLGAPGFGAPGTGRVSSVMIFLVLPRVTAAWIRPAHPIEPGTSATDH